MTITATPKTIRPHVVTAQLMELDGSTWWTTPMPSHRLSPYIWQEQRFGALLSDYDCATTCWCVKEG